MRTIHVFYSYAPEDLELTEKLETHLVNMQRNGQITGWHNREIQAGADWKQEIDEHLNKAQVILLLISADFLDSDYCYGVEMARAMERHKSGEAHVIPILLRSVEIEGASFGHLKMLPSNGIPITSSQNQDEAFTGVAIGIRKVVENFLSHPKEYWLAQGHAHHKARRYENALDAYAYALELDPHYDRAYRSKGDALYNLKRDEEALEAYRQALHLDPNHPRIQRNVADIHWRTGRYAEALAAYEQAIRLEPGHARTYDGKGNVLYSMTRYEEALASYILAIKCDPGVAAFYTHQGNTLSRLRRFGEALAAYEQAIQLNANDPLPYNNKGRAFYHLRRYREALTAFEQAIRLNPSFKLAYRNRADVFEQLGRTVEAQADRAHATQLPG